MTLVPDGDAADEGGVGTGNGGVIAIVNVADAADANRSQQSAGEEKPATETGGPADASTDIALAHQELEVIAGYRVHPAASIFPLIVGKQFEDFVEAASRAGRLYPVETHEGLLIDGRNRLRVQEELRRRGIEIDVPVVEWEPSGDETVSEHILSVNGNRRHQTDDQRAATALRILPFIRRERQERQESTRFGKGRPAAQISSPPGEPAGTPRTSRDKDAASTVGKFAAMCNIGMHKARQAIALADGVEAGEISGGEIIAIANGEKRLRDVVPCKRSSGSRKPTRASQVKAETAVDLLSVVSRGATLDAQLDQFLQALIDDVPVTEHREMCRRLKHKITKLEQQRGW